MPDLLSEVKSRLIDRIYLPEARGSLSDPYEVISLHAAVSNQLWWMCAGPQVPLQRTQHPASQPDAPPQS